MKRTVGLLILVTLGVAACGGGSPGGSPAGTANAQTAAATSTPESSETQAADAEGSAQPMDLDLAVTGVSNLTAYQMVLSVVSEGRQQTLTVLATKTPAEATHYVMTGDSPLEFISIVGEGAWMKQATYGPLRPGAAASSCPSSTRWRPTPASRPTRWGPTGHPSM